MATFTDCDLFEYERSNLLLCEESGKGNTTPEKTETSRKYKVEHPASPSPFNGKTSGICFVEKTVPKKKKEKDRK